MIKEIKGNLLDAKGIIAHQVNCCGVMGGGVAKQIRDKLLTPDDYGYYCIACKKPASELLGTILYLPVDDCLIANLFAEDKPTGIGLDTDYEALRKCFESLERFAKATNYPVSIPGYIGCGLAGGDWNYVYSEIICPIFRNSKAELTIVYLPETVQMLWNDFMRVPKEYYAGLLEPWHGFKAGEMEENVTSWFFETFDVDPKGRANSWLFETFDIDPNDPKSFTD